MTPKRRGWPAPVAVLLYIVLTMTVLWPIFSVPIPGLGDYLNHLARIHILATLDRSPDLQKFYDMHWGFAPYLGMDVIVTWLTRWIPLYQAGRLFAAVCVLMPVICAMALRAAVSKRVGLMPACAFLLSYNYLLSWGFLDYLFSAGLALLLFAGWIATRALAALAARGAVRGRASAGLFQPCHRLCRLLRHGCRL